MKLHIPKNIENIVPYPPGKPLEELERQYGITNSIKLASNENAWGPSPRVAKALAEALRDLHRYPDGSAYHLVQAIASHLVCQPEQVVLGNGSNEVIEFLVKAFVREGDEVITSHPSFLMYQKFVQVRGGNNIVTPLRAMGHDLDAILAAVSNQTRLIFIDNPNNPTGTAFTPDRFKQFLAHVPEQVVVVLDEAYVDFMDDDLHLDISSHINSPESGCPVVALRTFSKAYGLPGLRVGFGLMHQQVAECLHKVRQPFNINSLAQAGALAALEDRAYFQQVIENTRAGRQYLMAEVDKLGCRSFSSQTNFFLIDVQGPADPLYEAMLYKGVIVRSMSAYGFTNCIRITVGTDMENDRFLKALADSLQELRYGR